jgi:hypothetical protein
MKVRSFAKQAIYFIIYTYWASTLYKWGNVFLSSESDTESSAALVAIQVPIIVIAASLIWIGKFRNPPSIEIHWLLNTLKLTILTSLAISILGYFAWQYSPKYILGDTLRLMICWCCYFGILIALQNLGKETENTIKISIGLLLSMAILDGSLILVEFARNPGPKIHSSVYIFLVPAALFFFKNRPILKLFSLILFIAAALASGKRGTLLAAIISLALATGIIYSRDLFSGRTLVFRRSHLLRAAFLSVITGLSLILLDAVIPKESVLFRQSLQLLNNIASIFNDYVLHDEVDGSYQSRINEWLNVKEFYQRSPELILFGGGLGAEIDMIHDSSVYSDSGRMHHVHIGWIAYFLRNGLLGIILLLGYFGANMLIALKGMKSGIDRSFPSALLFITLFELFLSAKSSLMFQIFYPYTAILAGICIFKIYTNRTTSIAPQKLLSPAALLNREIIDSLSSKANTNRIRSTRSLPHSNA